MLLPGCIRVPSYSRKSLKTINDNPTYRKVKNNIIVQAKVLSEDNIQYLFDLCSKPQEDSFEVIYLSIHNFSTLSYRLLSADIDCTMLPYQKIVRDMKTSNAVGLTSSIMPIGATAFAFGIFLSGPVVLYLGLSLATVGISVWTGGIGLALVSVGRGIKSMVMNSRIKKI